MQDYYQHARKVYVICGFMLKNFESYFFDVKVNRQSRLDEDFQVIDEELDLIHDDAFSRKPQLLLNCF